MIQDAVTPFTRNTVLIVESREGRRRHLEWALEPSHRRVAAVASFGDALTLLSRERVSVIVTAEVLPDGWWQDVLRAGFRQAPAPNIVVVVADMRQAAKVECAGAYGVLEDGAAAADVQRFIEAALHDWPRQDAAAVWRVPSARRRASSWWTAIR